MKILVVSPHLPYPGVPHAGGVFLLAHLEQLTAQHDVTLVVPGSQEVQEHLHEAPAWLEVRSTPFQLERRPTMASQRDRARRRIRFASLGAPALRGLRADGLDALAGAADIVELHWVETAMLTRELRAAGITTPLVVVAYDVTAESIPSRGRRMRPGWRRAIAAIPNSIRRRTERADLAAADLVAVFKPRDQELLRQLGVSTPSHVVQPYVERPAPGAGRPRIPGSILFTGAMWRPENQDGVRWFLRSAWPKVVASVPDATFTIAGASPPRWLEDLAGGSLGVTVTGTVPRLDPYYEASSGFVAPLFVTGGLKFKVPQAMAHGLPVVATSIAVDGVATEAPPDTLWAVTDDADAMGDALIDLVTRPDDAARVGANAAAWAREHYSFERSTTELLEAYRRLTDRRSG